MKKIVLYVIILPFIFCFGYGSLRIDGSPGPELKEKNRIADLIMGSTDIYFTLKAKNFGSVLSIAGPQASVKTRLFKQGETPEFKLNRSDPDGLYTYELSIITVKPGKKKQPRKPDMQSVEKLKKIASGKSSVQSGYFSVKDGVIVIPGKKENLSTPLDIVHNDDVIIDGSLCVGDDCVNGEDFADNTQMFREHNLRIFFDDTSDIAGYPTRNWRIIINDSEMGGADYFAVQDADSTNRIFSLAGGAPANSLYVDDEGQVGLGTAIPDRKLHLKLSLTPSIRLEQEGYGAYPRQIWDLVAASAFFFIQDITHAYKTPFVIESDAPSNLLRLKRDGKVGIGTDNPEFSLEVNATGEHAMFVLERTDGAEFKLAALANKVQIGARSNHEVRFTTNNLARMTISAAGNVGIGNTAPAHKLVVGTSGAYCNGGAWVDGSSRAFKENIRDLSEADALNALLDLRPVRYNYRTDRSEEYLGFIAEDVPELVAMKDRRGMTAMDVVAVLTRVVQKQNRTISQQNKSLKQQNQKIQHLQELVSSLLREVKKTEN